MANWYTTNLEEFYKNEQEKLSGVMRNNALNLFLGPTRYLMNNNSNKE